MQVSDIDAESISRYPNNSKSGSGQRMYTRLQAKRLKMRKKEPLPLNTHPQVDKNQLKRIHQLENKKEEVQKHTMFM